MNRFFGLVFVAVGVLGGWLLGQPPKPEPHVELSPAAAWEVYRARQVAANTLEHDIPPHPATVALALAAASFVTLIASSTHPTRALAAAVWLRPHPSVRWN